MTAPRPGDAVPHVERQVLVLTGTVGTRGKPVEIGTPLVLVDGRPLPVKRVRIDVEHPEDRGDGVILGYRVPPRPVHWLMLELVPTVTGDDTVARLTTHPAPADGLYRDCRPERALMTEGTHPLAHYLEVADHDLQAEQDPAKGVYLRLNGDGYEGFHDLLLDKRQALALAAELTERASRLP